MQNDFETTPITERLKKTSWAGKIGFECYGAKIGIRFDDISHLQKLKNIYPPKSTEIPFDEAIQIFSLVTKEKPENNGFFLNSEIAYKFEFFEDSKFEWLESKIVLTLALISPPNYFYIHAGAISYNGLGIIIPGESFSGKTTLVKEFIQKGAEYFTDDCTVIDFEGNLQPFPNLLAVRDIEKERHFLPSKHFGSQDGNKPV
jgi:hypothetical protein